ncbi:hypothetical protein B0H98_1179 [Vreelandella songnenensis]|uniref:Uncharacterized protein n=1 Tax=Vreelandella songnenensis TaxID=1176243 RepID=A0A2T0ULV7_9GAMM|nr:hypothetical protein [Halomonas songnenensis]PRY58817.1 hypothetical protein B0H98_1179 [Halomonas songnenensis]
MWFIQPKQDYISQIPWKRADEPAVMSWQIKARNYNVFVANVLFGVLFIVCFISAYLSSFIGWSFLSSALMGVGMFVFSIFLTMSMTHQTTILVYRFTDQHAEECSWKPQMESVKPFLKWLAIISMPIVLVLILMDPSLLITSLGPLAMGFAAWMMGTSKGYQALQGTQHHEYDWTKAEEIVAWRKRNLIGLRFTYLNDEGGEYSTYSTIYCQPENFDENVEYFRNALPATPYQERELKVFSNFAL